MNSTAAIAGLAFLCATALPAQGERQPDPPPKAQKKADKPDAAVQRQADFEQVIQNLRTIRTDVEKATDVNRAELLQKAQEVLAVRLAERAAVLEKKLVAPRANEALLRAWLAKNTEARPSPLMKGDYQKAVEKLEAAQRAMRTAKDPEAAMRAIDEASKALMEARAAAWKQKAAKSEKKSEAKKDG